MPNCISCLGSEKLVYLFKNYEYQGETENYAELFMWCFNLKMSPKDGLNYICTNCTIKLRAARHFKLQAMKSKNLLLSTKLINIKSPVSTEFKKEYLDDSISEDVKESQNFIEIEVDKKPFIHIAPIVFIDPNNVKEEIQEKKRHPPRRKSKVNPLTNKKGDSKKTKNRKNDNEEKDKPKVKKPKIRTSEQLPCKLSPGQTICNECGEEFTTHKTLVTHMSSHYPEQVCEICGKYFMRKHYLQRHKRTHKIGPFTCKDCGKVFNKINTLDSHVRTHHRTLPAYPCSMCSKRFSTYLQRLNHRRKDHGLTECKYICPICNRKFYYSGQRSKHIRQAHFKLKPHECPQCPKRFESKGSLRGHLANKHDIGEKKFKCDLCSKSFIKKYILKEHMRGHMNDRRFSCDYCKATFIQKCSLKGHIMMHEKRGIFLKMEGFTAVLVDDIKNCYGEL